MKSSIKPSTPAPRSDLESRVASRKQELISEILEHKKNPSRSGAAESVDRIKGQLTELAIIVKEGVIDDWSNVGPSVRLKLDEWIAR